jgi:diaminopropionate ammonia-lyase
LAIVAGPFTYTNHFHNAEQRNELGAIVGALFSVEDCAAAYSTICQWPAYQATPLISMTDIAAAAGVEKVYYKDESSRFGLGSFKALGGSYAIECLSQDSPGDDLVVCTATDGNHGRAVAWGASLCGAECHVFIHANVSEARAQAIASLGAVIHRVEGNYDDSIAACNEQAALHGWRIVSDTSWEGYRDIPKMIMAGYSVMTFEMMDQLDAEIPSHVILQAGCGAMAGALIASMWHHWGARLPTIIMVESDRSDCVYQSLKRDEIHLVNIVEETVMAGLSCGEVSLLAWPLIQKGASHVVTIPDTGVGSMVRWLANPSDDERPSVIGGECSASGLIALLAIQHDPALAQDMGIDSESRVLVIGTEGNTDAEMYDSIIAGAL